MSSTIIDKPLREGRIKCYVKECKGEVKRSACIRVNGGKLLVFFCVKHWEKYVDKLYFKRHGTNY